MRTLISIGALPFILFPLVCSAVKLECEGTSGDGSRISKFIDTEENAPSTGLPWTVDEDKYYSENRSTKNGKTFGAYTTIYRSSGRWELDITFYVDGEDIMVRGKCTPASSKKKF